MHRKRISPSVSYCFHNIHQAIAQVEQFQEENKKQIEQQKSIAKQIVAMKNVATTLHTDEIFEDNMQHLEEEHRYQLQHQAAYSF